MELKELIAKRKVPLLWGLSLWMVGQFNPTNPSKSPWRAWVRFITTFGFVPFITSVAELKSDQAFRGRNSSWLGSRHSLRTAGIWLGVIA